MKTAIGQKWVILGYTMIFLILSILNGADTQTKEIAFVETSLNIGIVDKSNSNLSNELIAYLGEGNIVTEIKDDMEYIKEQIFLQVIDAVVLIPEGFQSKVESKEKSIEIIRDEKRMGPMQIENQINKFLVFSNASYRDGKFNLEKVKGALKEEVEVQVLQADKYSKNKGANIWFKYYFNFTSYIIIAVYVAVIGLIMTEFNSKNIQDRMKISPKKFLNFNIEIYLGQLTIGILITGIFILGSIVLKGKYIPEVDFIKYVVNISIFSFAILCFTFLINNLTTSRFVINGISTVASLGTAFISGVLVPQEFLGTKVLGIAKFFPTYYFVKINETNIESLLDVKYEISMQFLFAMAFLLMGLYFSKIQQKI
jgi:ABC-2 type transport system permease protein